MDMVDAVDQLSKAAATYEMNGEKLIAQSRLFRHTCGRQSDISLSATYLKVPRVHEALRAAYQILLKLPVASASVKKVVIKTVTHIVQAANNNEPGKAGSALMLCAVEKDLLKALSTEGLVAQFAAGADRQLDLG